MLKQAQNLLQKYYGYPEFRSGQEKIIDSILNGRDTLAIMPTGAGKSVCFQIPALMFPGITLVISPLISLMKDQVDDLSGLGIPAAFINSSLSQRETDERIFRARRGDFKLIYVAPERLESEKFCRLLAPLRLSLVAVDEAHCVSTWGHDFRPSYRGIRPFISSLPQRPVVAAFTATATRTVRADMVSLLELANPSIFITGFNRENLSFTVLRGENKLAFVKNYAADHVDQSGIIYAATRKEVDSVCAFLRSQGLAAGRYHAGMTDEERTWAQDEFVYDNIKVMVATNAFGMGIDKSNVRYVLHYNMPKNLEAYYQEAGRAGRDGEPGECILLYSAQDVQVQKFLIEQSQNATEERKTYEYRRLHDMMDYCHTTRCLRQYILHYFGETDVPAYCGNCGTCSDDREAVDITVDAQKIFSCIIRMKERYGVTLVADVLKGSKNKRVLQLKFDSLSTYGLLKDRSVEEIKDLINLLIAEGYLGLAEGEYPVVKIKAKAIPVLKGQAAVTQKILRRRVKPVSENTLFDKLKALRREIAAGEGIPSYIVFPDSTLREMGEQLPADMTALRQVKGVGEMKAARYGERFLAVIRDYAAGHGLVRPQVSREDDISEKQADKTPSHLVTLEMYRQGIPLAEIAKSRGLKAVTIEDHLMRCAAEGQCLNWDDFIPLQYEPMILAKINELGADRLRPLKDALPEEVSYLNIKAVIIKHRNRLTSTE
ncbi:MAG TPA: DNA helicase RecQ [Methylomusa anaerophila]|uniref:DNA helicase RecQ n=1 Tax=Methylomusa anaerophila TaxID=1930071 RepID=A0A348AH02_9FIRM|nr:DNA helicase RecQ [Methylomusa anaerophila]BBB90350.1 ATP-dependent DNA helicase RecQ [Methylomusa anaerophila]HML89304.1 DNA helicase RecQ [Methylomusa anaerophila]